MNKRERTVNFTRGEIDFLVDLVEKRKGIFENKRSDATTWRQKDDEWRKLEAEFNAVSRKTHFRSAKHLRSKYETLKRCVRKKSAHIRRETYQTWGGPNTPSPLTQTETKVKDMILLSVEGRESMCDSDVLVQLGEDVTGVKTVRKLAEIKKQVALLQRNLLLNELKDKDIDRKIKQKLHEENERERKREFEENEEERKFKEEMRQLLKEKILLEIKNLQNV